MKFHVMFISSYFPPITYGGVEKYLVHLNSELAIHNIRTSVITKHYAGFPKRSLVANIPTFRVGCNPFPHSTKRLIGQLSWFAGNIFSYQALGILESEGITQYVDIIHSQLGTSSDVKLGHKLSSKSGKPHIVTVHGRFGREPEDLNASSSIFNLLAKADHIIVNRPSSLKIMKFHGIQRATLIDNPIPVLKYSRPQELPGRTTNEKTRVLFIGRLTHRRGADLALKGFARAASRLPKIQLWMVGQGPLMSELRAFVKKENLEHRVRFFGNQSKTELFYWHSGIFLATSPSVNSPSLSLREAMAAGLAVVATNVERTSSIINDPKNGLLTAPEPEEIGKAIIRLANNELLYDQISDAAANYAKEKFDIRSYTTRLIQIYESLYSEGELIG